MTAPSATVRRHPEIVLAVEQGEGGRVFVLDWAATWAGRRNDRLQVYSTSGEFVGALGNQVEFNHPESVAAKGGRVYVVDRENSRVLVFLCT